MSITPPRLDLSPLSCVHIVASASDAAAGPSYSVPALCSALEALGAFVRLRDVIGWREEGAQKRELPGFTIRHPQSWRMPPLSHLCHSASLRDALLDDANRIDVLHSHGLWLMPNLYPAWASRYQSKRSRHIVSPRGMLGDAALSFSSRKKQLFWWVFQRSALRDAFCLHATSEAEYEDIRSAGLQNPVAIIPNGIDVKPKALLTRSTTPSKTIISLGRIHPKKGLDRLIRAWALVEKRSPGWRLRIIGPSERGHDDELRALAARLQVQYLTIEGPLFGTQKELAFASAELFVLPTLNENFAMTVAEALAAGVPVIATKGAPWSGLEPNNSGWWVDHGVEPLAVALRTAIEMPTDRLRDMGNRGRTWMEREYSWEAIAHEMLAVYAWIAGRQEAPSSVRFL